MSCFAKVLESLTKKIKNFFKDLKIFGVSGIYSELYLKPIWKDRNDGMTGVLFSWVKIDG